MNFTNKIKTSLYYITLLCALFFITNCNTKHNIPFKQIENLPWDSAKIKIDSASNWAILTNNYLNVKISRIETKDTSTIHAIKYLKDRGTLENYAPALFYYETQQTLFNLKLGKVDSAYAHARKSFELKDSHDSIVAAVAFHNLGLVHYFGFNNKDSALNYWKSGYHLAENAGHRDLISIFATNIGTIYYEKSNFRNARIMFRRAAEIDATNVKRNPILINNIINTFTSEKRFDEALKLWNENEKYLELDTQNYIGQLLLLTKINLLIQTEQIPKADSFLSMLNLNNIQESLKMNYARMYLICQDEKFGLQFLSEPQWSKIYAQDIAQYASEIPNRIIKNFNNPYIQSWIPEIEAAYAKEKDTSNFNSEEKSNLALVLGAYYKDKNAALSAQYYKEASKFLNNTLREQSEGLDELFDEVDQLSVMLQKIKNKEQEIKSEKFLKRILFSGIIVLIIILFLAIRNYRYRLKLKYKEQIQLEAQKEHLTKDQELNNRLVQYSKIVIEKNHQLKSEFSTIISQVSEPIKKEINSVIHNHMMTVIDENQNPIIANQIINEKSDWEDKYPGFNDLNKTEKRIFALTMEDYRPKEIAPLLGVSVQYIRNVKSKLRRKLDITDTEW